MKMSRQPSQVHVITDRKQPENVVYINYLGSIRAVYERCTREIESRIATAKVAFSKTKNLFTSKLDLNLRNKVVNCYIWNVGLHGPETSTLQKVDQKYLESFENGGVSGWRKSVGPIV